MSDIIQYIPRNMHMVFALLCFVVVIHWLIFPYPSGLLHWHCGNLTIAPVPAKQPWWIWINTSCEFIMNDCITTTKQSTTKPCAYFLGYTVVQVVTGVADGLEPIDARTSTGSVMTKFNSHRNAYPNLDFILFADGLKCCDTNRHSVNKKNRKFFYKVFFWHQRCRSNFWEKMTLSKNANHFPHISLHFKSLLIEAMWRHMATSDLAIICVTIGSGNGLLSEPMLIYHQSGPVEVISGHYHKNTWKYQSATQDWIYIF